MSELKRRDILTLPVEDKRVVNDRQSYIVVLPDGRRQAISLLRFQFNEPVPEKLQCLVKDINPITDELTLEQDFDPFLRRFYETGKDYEFFVTRETLSGKKKTLRLGDNYGFLFRLNVAADLRLPSDKHIICHVDDIADHRLYLSLSESVRLESEKAKDLQDRVAEALDRLPHERPWDRKNLVAHIFSSAGPRTFEMNCTQALRHLLDDCAAPRQTLEEIRQACLYLLEESDLITQQRWSERGELQRKLSKIIALADGFMEAVDIVAGDQCDAYLDSLISKLSKSGYIYQPDHQLGILETVFTLRPALMTARMPSLMAIIHTRPLDYWQQEPFRSAFIRLLEMYIRAARGRADLMASTTEDSVEALIEAISVQLCLATTLREKELDKLPIDLALSRAMLLRYCSYLLTRSPRTLLERSFRTLTGDVDFPLHYSWEDTQNAAIVANKLASYTPDEENAEVVDEAIQYVYKGPRAMLRIASGGILVSPATGVKDLVPVLPDEVALWHQAQVMLPETLSNKTRPKADSLKPSKAMWREIEQSLFAEAKPKVKAKHQFEPEIGETVHVRVDRVTKNGELHCIIEEDDRKGEGTLAIANIVDWSPRVFEECFISRQGTILLFKVKVTKQRSDATYEFQAKRLIRQWLHDSLVWGTKEIMMVKSVKNIDGIDSANGMTKSGVPVTAKIPLDMDATVHQGDFIEIVMDRDDDMRHANITVSGVRHVDDQWDDTLAFSNLIDRYADQEMDDDGAAGEPEVEVQDTEMDDAYLHELILLLDRQAAVETTGRAFNYLGLARVLALMMADKTLADYYSMRMGLLEILQDFTIDERVDPERLEPYQELDVDIFAPESQLRQTLMQVKALSYQDHPEHNADLWHIIATEPDENLRTLAQMVLARNFIPKDEMPHSIEEIDQHIDQTLNITRRKSTKPNYGRENKTTEFKTSLVYPPENHFRPDLRRQTLGVLKEVAAFLNAEGGTLYIGVNDQGTATGLNNDLAYRPFCYSEDKYDNYFRNAVKEHLGLAANALLDCQWEETNAGPVYVVKIQPSPSVVWLHTTVYERQGASSEPLVEPYLSTFLKKKAAAPQPPAEEKAEARPQNTEFNDAPSAADEPSKDFIPPCATPKARTGTIQTSRHRNNAYLNWDLDFIEPERYIFFLPDHTYCLKSGDQPIYDDNEADLILAIHHDEKSGNLILAYPAGRVARVSTREILEKKLFITHKRADDELLWAIPAEDDDYVFTATRDPNGYLYYRTDRVATLNKEKITDTGQTLSPYASLTILQLDIIPARLAALCKGVPGKAPGISATSTIGREMKADIERELGIEVVSSLTPEGSN